MADNSHRGWWQFSLRTVFWLMLCMAVGSGAYRWGFNAGRIYKEPASGNPFGRAKVYYVEDLLPLGAAGGTAAALKEIETQVYTNVLPETWKDRGGKASIESFDTNSSLVVWHNDLGQKQVATYLRKMRERRASDDPLQR